MGELPPHKTCPRENGDAETSCFNEGLLLSDTEGLPSPQALGLGYTSPSGCWFNLKGEKAVMYVTLSGFVIPQKVGRPTIVEGDLSNEAGRLTIQAKGIEIR
jgi:hypothetical protein